jgi:Sap, sulfolipid-1-addressing protein
LGSASAEDGHVGWAHVNVEFFLLAIGSALNPKLLAIDLLLARNRRARAMFLCVLSGAFVVALTIGLIDVLVIRANVINAQRRASADVDLALGVLLLTTGSLIFAGRLPRRPARSPSSLSKDPQAVRAVRAEKNGWARRVLREPRPGIAVVIGAIIGLPGALYLTALHKLVTGNLAATTQVIAVVVFVVIELSLIIVPFLFLELRPAGTAAMLERSQGWLLTYARQAIAWIAVVLGAYLVISALIRLL